MTTNPRNIVWPQDSTGFLYGLKNAGVKAVERQMGSIEKHKALMETLKVLFKHAKARFEMQAGVRQARIDKAAAESGPLDELEGDPTEDTTAVPEPTPAPTDDAGEGAADQTEKPADDKTEE